MEPIFKICFLIEPFLEICFLIEPVFEFCFLIEPFLELYFLVEPVLELCFLVEPFLELCFLIAARQGGRIIVDEQGYHYKKTSVNKKTGVSYLRCWDKIAEKCDARAILIDESGIIIYL